MTNLFYFDMTIIYYVACEFAVKILPILHKISGFVTGLNQVTIKIVFAISYVVMDFTI